MKRFLHFVVVTVCLLGAVMGTARAADKLPFHAFAWQLDELNRSLPWQASPYPNLTHFYWLTQSDLEEGNVAAAAAKLKAAMAQLPAGRRAVFDWDNSRLLWQHPEDQLKTAGGVTFTGPWWDHGAAQVRARFDRFFKAYREMGGELDVFVLDMEHGVGGSGVGGGQEEIATDTREKWGVVWPHPLFAATRKVIQVEDPARLLDRSTPEHARWQAYAFWLTARYLNEAMYEPVRAYFPQVKFSNYGAFMDKLRTPRPNGTPPEVGDVPGRYGAYVGTH